MKPVINTEKHIVQVSLNTITSGSIINLVFATSVAVPTAVLTEVREGSIIKAIYFEMWITSNDSSSGTAIVTFEKVEGSDSTLMTSGESAGLGSYTNKKNVFHTQMGLIPSNTQYPLATIKGWFKIPKGKQRFGLGDRLVINIHGQSSSVQMCGFGLYKEQY